MPLENRCSRTHADFDEMSWHDNHVHGLQIGAGENGSGELILGINCLVGWLNPTEGVFQFRIAPAILTFAQVTDLRLDVDYASASAAFGPFSTGGIERE